MPFGDMVYWPHARRIEGGWRLYFLCSSRERSGWRGAILSAFSADGQRWSLENGERISPDGEDVDFCEAPWVVEIAEGLRMYYVASRRQGGSKILSAVSTDGIIWRKEESICLAPFRHAAALTSPCVIPAAGGWRMYYTASNRENAWIATAISRDGREWQPEADVIMGGDRPGPRRNCRNPAVYFCGSEMRMVFAADDGLPWQTRLYNARSANGLEWESEGEALDASGPWEGDGVNFPHVSEDQGRGWRLFYTGFWGPHILRQLTRWVWRQAESSR